MEDLTKAGRYFYGIGIAGLGAQQFVDADFRPVILPAWPAWVHATPVWAYIAGAMLIVAGILIIFDKKIKPASLFLAGLLFFFFIAFQVVYILFIDPNSPRHLGLWTNALKELVLSGGALVIAGTFIKGQIKIANKDNLIRIGSIFMSVTMIAFGIDHFLYTDFVTTLVPSWIPGHLFWTYFAGVALIAAGVAIILKIKLQMVALLLGIMIFLWFIFLHIPRAVTAPYMADKGNETTSVFEALVFSGIAFIIAGRKK